MRFPINFKLPPVSTKEWLEENRPRALKEINDLLADANKILEKIEWKE